MGVHQSGVRQLGGAGTRETRQPHPLQHSSNWCQFTPAVQDTLGDRQRCEAEFWNALQQGSDIIVDRCNHTRRQRATWLQLAAEMARRGRPLQLLCLALELPPTECKRRATERTVHATLSAAEASAVIDRFLMEFEPPAASEGFHHVHRVSTPEQVHHVLHTHLLPLHGGWLQQAQQTAERPAAAAAYAPQQQAQQGWQGQAEGWRRGASPGAGPSGAWGQPPWRPQPQLAQQAMFPPRSPAHAAMQQQRQYSSQQGLQDKESQDWRRQQADGARVPDGGGGRRAEQRSRSPSRRRPPSPLPTSPRAPASPSCGGSSNIVPFGRGPGGGGPASPTGGRAPGGRPRFLDDGDDDPRPILLWDMNGTLTSHTHQRRSTGKNLPRPGTHHLRRLAVSGRSCRGCW